MLKKLFGGKKSGFFLELKEEISQEKTSKPEKSAQPKAEKQPSAPVAVEPKHTEPTEPQPTEPASNSSKSKKKSIKAKKSASGSEQQAKAKSEKVPLLTPLPEKVTASSQNGKAEPQEVAFATKNFPNPTMARRRPGPSLNTFKNMARQVKKPSSKG